MGPRFGQLVAGPPGSGKTTYCRAAATLFAAVGRPCAIVNLDPANDGYRRPNSNTDTDNDNDDSITVIDIADLITLQDAMDTFGLGPNGGLVYCLEYLERNFDWLHQKLATLPHDTYVLFDTPGQVELATHHRALPAILQQLTSKTAGWRLCCVHLVDAHHCVDPARYVAALVVSLRTMIQLELPHVNVLSKVDLVPGYGQLAFGLDYYARAADLSYLVQRLDDDPRTRRFAKLNSALCGLVEDFGLVGFQTLCVNDKRSLVALAHAIDHAIGYVAPDSGEAAAGSNSAMEAFNSSVSTWIDGQDEIRRMEDLYLNTTDPMFDSKSDPDVEELHKLAQDPAGQHIIGSIVEN